jgi:hypothetical protein
MHGVPANLDLQPLHGACLEQLRLGQYQLQLWFSRGPTISVEGGWLLKDADGKVICESDRSHYAEKGSRLHVLLGATVTFSRVDPPVSFTLGFDNGMSLTILDDSDQYESFSIGGVIV